MERIEPGLAEDERTMLTQFLDYQRATFLGKIDGLDKKQMSERLAVSTLTLAGLTKHLALVEDSWFDHRFAGNDEREPWAGAPFDLDPDWEFHTALDDQPAQLVELYGQACERSRKVVAAAPSLDDESSAADRHTGKPFSLRWIIVHMIEETARHNGHADLLREAIDGSVGE